MFLVRTVLNFGRTVNIVIRERNQREDVSHRGVINGRCLSIHESMDITFRWQFCSQWKYVLLAENRFDYYRNGQDGITTHTAVNG